MQVLKRFLARLLALCAFISVPAWAAPQATVAAVLAPAWIERAGYTQPLAVGMSIVNGDRIRTGEGARAYLTLAEGSTVKLGENAKLAFFSLSLRPQREFKGALDVLGGAFRFTTDALKRIKSREVVVRVGTATAGIRGTDIWGRSDNKEDLICLIEGKIDFWHAALPVAVAMSEPMTYVVAPKGEAPKPVAAVDPQQFDKWARQTEIMSGDGAARNGGKWKLSLGRYTKEGDALAQYDLARNEGYASSIKPFAADSGAWNYEVILSGFPDEGEAITAAARLKTATGIEATVAR